jgi:hypothetical protein
MEKNSQEYLRQIKENEIELTGTDELVANKFRETGERIEALGKELKAIDKRNQELKGEFLKLTLSMDAYADILLSSRPGQGLPVVPSLMPPATKQQRHA